MEYNFWSNETLLHDFLLNSLYMEGPANVHKIPTHDWTFWKYYKKAPWRLHIDTNKKGEECTRKTIKNLRVSWRTRKRNIELQNAEVFRHLSYIQDVKCCEHQHSSNRLKDLTGFLPYLADSTFHPLFPGETFQVPLNPSLVSFKYEWHSPNLRTQRKLVV